MKTILFVFSAIIFSVATTSCGSVLSPKKEARYEVKLQNGDIQVVHSTDTLYNVGNTLYVVSHYYLGTSANNESRIIAPSELREVNGKMCALTNGRADVALKGEIVDKKVVDK